MSSSFKRRGAVASIVALFASVAVPVIISISSPASGLAGASVAVLRQRAATLASQVDVAQSKLEILSEEYDQAQSRQATLLEQIANDKGAYFAAQHSVQLDNSKLHKQAVDAYVNSGSVAGISAVLSSSANVLPLQQTYLGIASASLNTAVSTLKDSEHALSVREVTLNDAETQASAAANALSSSQEQASSIESQLSVTLKGVTGNLAAAVSQQEAQQAAQQAAAAAASAAAAQAAQVTESEGGAAGGIASTSTAVSGNDPGAVALSAAETQLGVPYVWAGETPGAGFDCSGLAMWAWSKAGVNLPHSAEEQYNDIEHVPFSQLQPGDLIFYASGGYIYHVIMYVGGGRAIQAIDTGTAIQYTPVWPGAIGAGRP